MADNGTGSNIASVSRRAADGLRLAAAPAFAMMALLCEIPGRHAMAMQCPAAQGGSPLEGMTAMYALMALFHMAPWLKRVAKSRSDGAGVPSVCRRAGASARSSAE